MSSTDKAIAYANDHRDAHLDELRDLVAIPSISTVPESAADIRRAARWLCDWITAEGARGKIIETGGNPLVWGEFAAGSPDAPSVLWAFRPSDVVLRGRFVDLPWQVPPRQRASHLRRQGDGFLNHVTGRGLILGRFPEADRIRLQGAYGMRPESMMTTGDGVVRLNGREVLRVPAGERPYRARAFDVDISAWAGQHVLLEFTAAGRVRALALADWHEPRIVIEP